jgi:hypothetical protein
MREMDGEHFQKFNRLQRQEPRRRKRPTRNKHHMTNKSRGGKGDPSNLLVMKIERHSALHRVFRNMSWEEIGEALYSIFQVRDPEKAYQIVQRVARMKGRVA